jgi:hypothetical protein
MRQMPINHRRNEVITVVVASVPAQGQRLAGLGAGSLESFRVQLLLQKLVGQPLVDQDAGGVRGGGLRGHEQAGVVLNPC